MSIGGLIALTRPHYSLPIPPAYALTVFYARGGRMAGEWAAAWLTTAALVLVIAAGYVLNDVFDVRADRVNAPGRPIASGRVPRGAAAAWGTVLLAAGLALALAGRPALRLTLAAVAGGLVLYDATSKRLGLAKPLAVAALMTSIYPLALAQAGGAAGARAASLAVFPAWLFVTAFAYELLKDVRDVVGDRLAAVPGPVQRRPERWRRVAGALLPAASLLLIAPCFLGCRWVYLALAAPAITLAFAAAFVPVRAAIAMAYAECFLVMVAATADVAAFGV